ncbi:MAG: hypothetical protein A2283_19050 [Lentisphaerae bacterium RIFOXYA12_FULL_48_11]|nr:MAG: hypothetical protein A2283_19050 [Lentisphaerae bacterium RIFOXYA12_FULL_48_11]
MSDLVFNPRTKELCGRATDINDWARKCDEFEKETGVKVPRPGSAQVRQKPGAGKEYKLRL